MNSNNAESATPQKRVQLPDPDMDNITVLTRELPNAPILPWHHYDSPWLEPQESEASSQRSSESTETPDDIESDTDEKVTNITDAMDADSDNASAPSTDLELPTAVPTEPVASPADPSIAIAQTVPPSIPVPLQLLQDEAAIAIEPLPPLGPEAEPSNPESEH